MSKFLDFYKTSKPSATKVPADQSDSLYKKLRFQAFVAGTLGYSLYYVCRTSLNVMKKPIIMLPMVISSAICGPLSTCVFGLQCGASGGGMGTSGLVGVFDLFAYTSGAWGYVGIILLMFM